MTQLLISVKNVEEALIALTQGVDIIDLKDPEVGALGALDIDTTAQILQLIQQHRHISSNQTNVLTSATVGENHANLNTLFSAISARAKMGIDLIKIAVSGKIFDENLADNWISQPIFNRVGVNPQVMTNFELFNVKLVAVFFADQLIDFSLLEKLKGAGFYGAMLDTSMKHQNLLDICTKQTLQNFTQTCHKNDLESGLAGSLKPQHIEYLMDIKPRYVGFRGGVCEGEVRKNALAPHKIIHVKKLLHEHNKFNGIAHKSSNLALHS